MPVTDTRHPKAVFISQLQATVLARIDMTLSQAACSGVMTPDTFKKAIFAENRRANAEIDQHCAEHACHDSETEQEFYALKKGMQDFIIDCAEKAGWYCPDNDNHTTILEGDEPALIKQHVLLRDFSLQQEDIARGASGGVSLYRAHNGDLFAGKSSLGQPTRNGIPVDELREELDAYQTVYRRAGPHPNLLNVYGIARLPCTSGAQRTLLMDVVTGKTGDDIASLLRGAWQSGKISSAEYWSANQLIARRLLAVTAHLGQAGIVHNDIKPANYLIDAGSGEPVVIDLGVACRKGQNAVAGTRLYISPEARALQPVSERSDVLTVGATLLRSIEGDVAFDANRSLYLRRDKAMLNTETLLPVPPNTGLFPAQRNAKTTQGHPIRQPGTYSARTSYSQFMQKLINERSESAEAIAHPFLSDSMLDDEAAKAVLRKVSTL